MTGYAFKTVAEVVKGTILQEGPATLIRHLVTDSRQIHSPQTSLFFALQTSGGDGHRFLVDACRKGVRNFVVSAPVDKTSLPDTNIIKVTDTLKALQALAAFHRQQFSLPVIGITGSNGKTIVKEWLYQLLHEDYTVARSPRSYNSQIGVPLSVWALGPEHTLAIFEAGISTVGEMGALADTVRPTIGVLTNIGDAHNEGFSSSYQKLQEKLLLFKEAEVVVGPHSLLQGLPNDLVTIGPEEEATLQLLHRVASNFTEVSCRYRGEGLLFRFPFGDEASLQNGLTCCAVMLHLGYSVEKINERLRGLHPIDMRLQLKHGINGCVIINDSYSADLTSLQLALNFMTHQKTAQKRTAILSDFVESGQDGETLYRAIASALIGAGVQRVIAIGEGSSRFLSRGIPSYLNLQTFPDTQAFLDSFRSSQFVNETVLVKGARRYHFERIVQALETKVHQTVLEINLNALAHNLKQYGRLLQPGTKTMAMVKAFSYGSGSAEIASTLQFNNIDYLGVAYADEGAELRRAGIHLPIMVINADEAGFPALVEHGLQPVLYSFGLLRQFENYIRSQGLTQYPVHLELETGMNRLGFAPAEVEALGRALQGSEWLQVQSLFSHLVASEDPEQDAFTARQASLFEEAARSLEAALGYSFLKHIANTAAIIRHPHLQYDMVRLGIGLYGIETAGGQLDLQPVATLRSTIAQLKRLKAGETVSYNRRGVVTKDSLIATVRIGYADGYSRRLGHGVGKMLVAGQPAPVVGTVCMDMTMVDVTDIPGVKEGDSVVVFGAGLPVQDLAAWAGTIPYEIMTSVSQRVKRVYFQE